jgi:hypothetical protein
MLKDEPTRAEARAWSDAASRIKMAALADRLGTWGKLHEVDLR